MPVVGTAGHVDHGKSTLIQRITGRNPDRWEEERRRGLTIDLGFAWTTLPGGTEVSFVDVPGHERFLKNMLAGIEAIDVALLVVAADEGWMPQSEEHLAVLDLLEVRRGVVALTKSDLVDDDMLQLAHAEAVDRIADTSLADAAVVPLSALTGDGIEELLDRLADQIDDVPAPGRDRPRMWVDRSFPVSGAGTVVTGTLLDGELGVDEAVEILPIGRTARIRGIQSHEKAHQSVGPGRRVALNLGGIDHDQVRRGDMIGLPGQWDMSRRFAVTLETARFVDELDQRGAYQLHIGSSSHRVELTGMLAGTAMFHVDRYIPVAVGDRFILRDTGRRLVVGGGRVIDPAPGRTAQALADVRDLDPSAHPDAIATRLLEIRGHDDLSRLSAHSRGGKPVGAAVVGGQAIDLTALEAITRRAMALVEKDHADHPLRSGTPLATLAERLGVEPAIAEALVERTSLLDRIGPDVARAGHRGALTTDQAASWEKALSRLAESLAVPAETDLGLDPDVIGLKIRSGELIRIGPGLVYLPEQIEELKECMSTLGDGFSVAEFRDAAGLSRKYAVPILEWSDREGLTVRRGDVRRVR